MTYLRELVARMANMLAGRNQDERLRSEIAEHIELQTEENIRSGMTAADGRRNAILKFGPLESIKETYRDQESIPWIEDVIRDAKYATRVLRKSPGFAFVAVLTLALAVGANATIFTLVNVILLRPLPGLSDPERLVTIGTAEKGQGFNTSSYANYRDLRDQNTVFSDVTAAFPVAVSISTEGHADRVHAILVTSNYFHTLGVHFARGGGFIESDDLHSAAPPQVVISYHLWVERFASNGDIVGKTAAVDGVPMTIAGVAARGFIGTDPTSAADAWIPMSAGRQILPSWLDMDEWGRHRNWVWLMLYCRLKPGVTFQQANAEVQTIAARLRSTSPELQDRSFGWALSNEVGFDPDERADLARITYILFGVVGLLLLIACANVSNLLLARAAARSREMSVRLALGASRWRLLRQLLIESVLLSLIGGLTGFGLSLWASLALSRFFSGSSRFTLALDLSPDWRVFTFMFAIAAVTGVMIGIVPGLRSSRSHLVSALKESVAPAPRRSRLRPLLVVAQVAVSFLLLVGAGVLLRTLWNLNQIRPGFDARNLDLMTIEPTHTGPFSIAQLQTFYPQLLQRVQALPGVDAATLARSAPVSAHGWGVNTRFPDKPNSPIHGVPFNTVAPNYFETMGIPIVHGRGFTLHDNSSSPPVVVINQTLANAVWPGQDAIGKQIIVADEKVPREIIGIVPDLKYRSVLEKPSRYLYLSMWQPYPMPDAPCVIHVRSHMPLAQIAIEVQREVQTFDANVPIFDVKSVGEQIADSYWRQRMTGVLIAIFAGLALTLATAGMYGVMSYIVAERTREVGIRMALGARATDVVRMIIAYGGLIVLGGLVLGAIGALVATRVLASLLYGVTARDTLTLLATCVVLATTGLLATFVPARRASTVDPMVALRYE